MYGNGWKGKDLEETPQRTEKDPPAPAPGRKNKEPLNPLDFTYMKPYNKGRKEFVHLLKHEVL
jgi:hypothetical protein